MKSSACFILLLNIVHFVREKFYFQVTFVVKAVSAFSAAVFLMQAEQCQGRNLSECSQISNINLQQEILSTLSRLSFTSQQKAPFELQGTSIHVTHDGQLISNKYVIFHIRDTGDVSGVSSNYLPFLNKVRELIMVKVLHTSLLNTSMVVFRVLPLGNYTLIPAPSPPFKTILELGLWNGLQSCRCITPDVVRFIKMPSFQYFLYLREQKKVTGG